MCLYTNNYLNNHYKRILVYLKDDSTKVEILLESPFIKNLALYKHKAMKEIHLDISYLSKDNVQHIQNLSTANLYAYTNNV